MAARVSLTEAPRAWNSARAWVIRLVTAELAPSVSARWEASIPTSLPVKVGWRSARVFMVRVASARNPATLRA
eukprot:9063515-Alexandrium_andersonii.AAC.1